MDQLTKLWFISISENVENDQNDPNWDENEDNNEYCTDDDEEEFVKEKTRSYFNYFNFIIAAVRFGLSSYATTVMIWAMLIDQGITDKSMYPSEFRVRTMMEKYGNLLKERYICLKMIWLVCPKYILIAFEI